MIFLSAVFFALVGGCLAFYLASLLPEPPRWIYLGEWNLFGVLLACLVVLAGMVLGFVSTMAIGNRVDFPLETKVILFLFGLLVIGSVISLLWIVGDSPHGPSPIHNKKCAVCNRWFAMVEQSGKLIKRDSKFGIPTYRVEYRCRWCGALVVHEQQSEPRICIGAE